jgi:F-type H+-transporting ATPase subunit b
LLFLALMVGASGATPAWASEPGAEKEKQDILSPRLDLSLWTIVVFVVLLLVLRKFAWRPMLEGLHKREQAIQGALDEAQHARADAQRLRDQLQGEIDRAQEQVRDILDQGRRDAQRTTEDMLNRARTEIQAERDRLRREIDLARDNALQDLWGQAARLATLVSAKAIRRHLTPADHERLVQEAVAEMGAGASRRTG